MKRMVVYVKRLFFMYMNPPATELTSSSGFEPIPGIHYVPAADEPSLFGDGPDGINSRWIAWYLKRNTNKGYVHTIVAANQIRMGLNCEPPRVYSNRYLPPILVGPSKLISLEWVIWYHYEFGVGLGDAHQIAVSITGRE